MLNHERNRYRGFAGMSADRQRLIASKGGRAAHAKGTAHEFDSREAKLAGRRGGLSVSRNRVHMAEIGRRGGLMRGKRARHARLVELVNHVEQVVKERQEPFAAA